MAANLARIDEAERSTLWVPFILILIGCMLRVTLQIATDFVPGVFKLIASSGVLEWTAMAWWSVIMLRMLLRRGETWSIGLRRRCT